MPRNVAGGFGEVGQTFIIGSGNSTTGMLTGTLPEANDGVERQIER